MWRMLVYGVHKLQEVRKRSVRLTEILDILYYLPKRWVGIAFYDNEEEYAMTLEELTKKGYLSRDGNGNFVVTERGRRIAEALGADSYEKMLKEYIDEVVKEYTKV